MHLSHRAQDFLRTLRGTIAATEGESVNRGLPVRQQLRIVAAAAGALCILVLAAMAYNVIREHFENTVTHAELKPGTFRPTRQQLSALAIKPVAITSFRGEEIADGTIAVDDELSTPVFSPYSGRVIRLNAKIGDVVKRGTPLVTIEASEFAQMQSDLIAAAGAVDAAEAQLNVATLNEKRAHDLYDVKGGALREWQQAQADLANARAAQRSARGALNAARNKLRILGKSDSQIDALARSQNIAALTPTVDVIAPIDGTVIQRQVGLGQFLQAGASAPIFSIGDLAKVWLIANVRETDAAKVRVGQQVDVRVPAYPDHVFKARVTSVGPGLDTVTHRLPVRAEIDNADGALKPQMFASLGILTGDETSAIGVPESAIVTEGSSARVWVAFDDGTLALREIQVGRTAGHLTEVTSGLSAGDKVVTAGALFIDRAAQME